MNTNTSSRSCIRHLVSFLLELCEQVGVLGRDAVRLQDGDPHGEVLADLEMRWKIVQRFLLLILNTSVNLFF